MFIGQHQRQALRALYDNYLSQDDEQVRKIQIGFAQIVINELLDYVEKKENAARLYDNRIKAARRHAVKHLAMRQNSEDRFDPRGWFVYLLWGADYETPLYVGESTNVLSRVGSHMANPERRSLIENVQFIRCAGVSTMHKTEAALIKEFSPPLNVKGKL